MHNTDDVIETVINALGKIEADPQFESRILKAVAAHAHAPSRGMWVEGSWLRWVNFLRANWRAQLAWRLGVAGLLAAVLVLMFVQQKQKKPILSAGVNNSPALVPAQQRQNVTSLAFKLPAQTTQQFTHKNSGDETQKVDSLEERALLEMHAPSHQARDAPLTEEEKLLVRAVHHETPQLFAMLNPQKREEQEAAEKAEFEAFFKPSGTGNWP
jgi:hypothetical protein